MINFNKYDEENPMVWVMFVQLSHEAKQKGFKNFSANGIFEIMRWETKVRGNDAFKINNNYRADYARKLMKEDNSFDGFFRTREIKAKRK